MKIAILILLASTCCFSYNDLVIRLNKKVDSSYVVDDFINFKNDYNRILVVYENNTDVYFVKNHSDNMYQKYKYLTGNNDSTLQQIFICYTDTLLYRISIQLSGKNYLYQYNLSETSGFIILKNDTYTPPNVQIDPMDSASVNRKIRRHNNGDQNSNSNFQQNTAINNNSIYPYADCVVRVLVAYTSKAESQAIIRGYREINDMIHDYITQTNITFENSNINAKIKLAKTMKVNYDDAQNKDIDDILEDF